jgi:hypothetical protein
MHKTTAVFILTIFGCTYRPPVQTHSDQRDLIVKNYLKRIDSSSIFHDTTDFNYKVLKAYVKNDSAFFLNMKNLNKQLLLNRFRPDTCVHTEKLVDLHVDEAYRFRHSESFCDYKQIITVSKLKDSILLDYLEFSNGPGEPFERSDGMVIISPCKITRSLRKQLNLNEWNLLQRKIYDAEYYGMKSYYNNLTTDGSWWQLEAYKKDPSYLPKYYSVFRHSPANSKFCEVGIYIMKLSGAKKMCSDFF